MALASKTHQTLFSMVSIGMPTYNRALTLREAIESVLRQDYKNIELIISDNASTDETQMVCSEFCNKDSRVRYIRQQNNLGPTENFREVLNHARGEFFMWLSDDDWIDVSYISECVKVLVNQTDVSLVAGISKYYCETAYKYEGKALNLLDGRRTNRVLSYYWKVTENGTFYGIMRKSYLSQVLLGNTMGADWLLVGSIVFMGKIKTIDNVSIHRRLGGTTESYERIASSLSLPQFEKKFPHISIAVNAFRDISSKSPIYKSLGNIHRNIFALCVFCVIFTQKIIYREGLAKLSRMKKLILRLIIREANDR